MTDLVNHPPHYADGWSNGAEVIDITENLSFNRGNAVKYIARAGKKDPAKELEDLEKAEFYLKREIGRVKVAKAAKAIKEPIEPGKLYPRQNININGTGAFDQIDQHLRNAGLRAAANAALGQPSFYPGRYA